MAAGFDLLITGGRLVTEGGILPGDLAIEGERIVEIASSVHGRARRRIDAEGLLILPGLIDPHVHFGLPMKGTATSDDPATGTTAALFGGVTTVIDFTLQRPGQSLGESFKERLDAFEGRASCDYALHANLTDFPPGFDRRLSDDLDRLAAQGAASLKLFTAYSKEGMSVTPDALDTVFRCASKKGFRILVHAEDDAQVTAAQEDRIATRRLTVGDFPGSRPAEAEAKAISDACAIAREAGSAVYFVHVSTAGGAAAIREARRVGSTPVYMETCPQYLLLDESRYAGPDAPQYLVAPPLRSEADQAAMRSAIENGEVDVVATDHCCFTRSQKDRPGVPFLEIPNGLPGVETRLPLLHTIAVETGRFDLTRVVHLTSTAPARIFGLYPRKGVIAVGSDADLVFFDPRASWTINPEALHMATDFSPYLGFQARGRVRTVILRGSVVLEDGCLTRTGLGEYAGRRPGTRMAIEPQA